MQVIFIDLKPGTRHADLYIHNTDYVFGELLSDNVKKEVLSMVVKETNSDKVLFSDNAIMVTEASLYENGLFMRIEQVRPWRSTYDNATCELIITNKFITYAIIKADDGRYNLVDLSDDSDYSVYVEAYKKSIKALGNKVDIEPFEKVFNDEVEKQNLKGIFKKSKRDALDARLFLEYKEYKKSIESYIKLLPQSMNKEKVKRISK